MKYILVILTTLSVVSVTYAGAVSPGDYYVTSKKLNVRLAADKKGKITNTLYKGQKVEVFEIKDGWARISKYYESNVEGPSGRLSGKVARWVFTKHLSVNRPTEKKRKVDSPVAEAIKTSDDFLKHKKVFVSVTEKLINSGVCKLAEFKEQGGWMRSPKYKPKPVYFIYCGGYHRNNRMYVNTKTGAIFR